MPVAAHIIHVPHDPAVLRVVDEHIDAMVYNVASILSATTMLSNKTKIDAHHVTYVKDYVWKQCGGAGTSSTSSSGTSAGAQAGGNMPAEFYGYSTGQYNAPSGGIDMATVNFAPGGDARPGLDSTFFAGGSGSGGSAAYSTAGLAKIAKTVFKFNGLSISKTVLADLIRLIVYHIHCLAKDLNKPKHLTLAKTTKIFALKRNQVFK